MPSIAQAVAKNQAMITSGQKLVVDPSEASAIPGENPTLPTTAPPNTPVSGLPIRGVYTPDKTLNTDFANTTQAMRGANLRSATFPPIQQPSTKTVVQKVFSSPAAAAQGLLLETNSIKNPLQTLLNVISTATVTASIDANGNLSFTATSSGGDGLIHGDPLLSLPWETDPAFVFWRDDFQFHKASATVAGTAAAIGELGWTLTANSGVNAVQPLNLPFPYSGTIAWQNTTSAALGSSSACGQLVLDYANSTTANQGVASPLLDSTNWAFEFIFSFDYIFSADAVAASFNQKTFYIGLASDLSILSPVNPGGRPFYFIGLRFDKDNTAPAISDSVFTFEAINNNPTSTTYARNNTQGTVIATTVTPTLGVIYKLIILSTTAGKVALTLYGSDGSLSTGTFTMPKVSVTNGNANITSNHGNGQIVLPTTPLLITPWGAGAKVTVSGSSQASFNGAQIVRAVISGSTSTLLFDCSSSASITDTGAWTVTGYPSLRPYITFGNDTEATPISNMSFILDYVSFIWNPGVGGGTGTPSTSKMRFW